MLIAEMQYSPGLTSTESHYEQLEKALAEAKVAIASNLPVDDWIVYDMVISSMRFRNYILRAAKKRGNGVHVSAFVDALNPSIRC